MTIIAAPAGPFHCWFAWNTKGNPNYSGLIVDRKQKNIHKTNCHEGLSATNPNDMACMFNKYFELASNNNTYESLAFGVAEIAFKVPVITFQVADISVLLVKITFVVVEIIFKEDVITSLMAMITLWLR